MKVLITDLDNTLCKCGPYYREAVEQVAADIAKHTGLPVLDAVTLIDLIDRCMIDARGIQAFQLDRMREAFEHSVRTAFTITTCRHPAEGIQHPAELIADRAMKKILKAEYPLLPGVRETLELYHRHRWRIVVWTKGEETFQFKKVASNQLLNLIDERDVYVTPVKQPDTLEQLLIDLNIPRKSVGAVVGDSYRDEIRCAEMLGLPAILVGGGFGPPGYEPDGESMIDSFADLPKVLPVGWNGTEAQDGSSSSVFTGS